MRRSQTGVSLLALIFILILVAIVALFGMKTVPSYIEFRTAKKAIEEIARQQGNPVDIRRAFENRSAIDDITTIKPTDLEIGKDGNAVVISFAYRKEVPLFKNVGLYIDYAASAGGQ